MSRVLGVIGNSILFIVCLLIVATTLLGGTYAVARAVVWIAGGIGDSAS